MMLVKLFFFFSLFPHNFPLVVVVHRSWPHQHADIMQVVCGCRWDRQCGVSLASELGVNGTYLLLSKFGNLESGAFHHVDNLDPYLPYVNE